MKSAGQQMRIGRAAVPQVHEARQTSQQVQAALIKAQIELKEVKARLVNALRDPQVKAVPTKATAVGDSRSTITRYEIPIGRFNARELQQYRAFGFQVTKERVIIFRHSNGRISNERNDLDFMGIKSGQHPLNRVARHIPKEAQDAFRKMFRRGFFTTDAIRRSGVNIRHLAVKMAARNMRNLTSEEYGRIKSPQGLVAIADKRGVDQQQLTSLIGVTAPMERSQIWVK